MRSEEDTESTGESDLDQLEVYNSKERRIFEVFDP